MDLSRSKFLAVSGLWFIIISIAMTLKDLSWTQQVVPDIDLAKCPAITDNPKRIWAYWHTGLHTMPLFIQENIKMWKAINPDWEIRAITGDNENDECHWSKFIGRDLLPSHFEKFFIQLKADAVRLALLRLYGGAYLDCSIILLEPLELSHWNYVDKKDDDPNRKHLVAYYASLLTRKGLKDGLEIWLLVCKAMEPLMVAWHDFFLEATYGLEDPLVVNKTTLELMPPFKGTEFPNWWGERIFNYGYSTNCMHVVLQANKTLDDLYNCKSIIYNADGNIFLLRSLFGFDNVKGIYDFLFNRKHLTRDNVYQVTRDTPLQKLFMHAYYITDELYNEWRNPYNRLGFIKINLAERGRVWKKDKVWDYSLI